MSSEPPSKRQKIELSDEDLVHLFHIDFKSQSSKEILELLVDFLNGQLKFTPQEFGNSTKDKGDELCKILSNRGFINSIENIKTKFRDLLAKVNEDDRFDGLSFLYQWLEQWIAIPGFRSNNKSKLAANVELKLFILMEKDLKKVKEDNKFIIHPLCSDLSNEKIGDKLVLEKVLEFLNESKKKVLLILGNAGSGKSTCCQIILRMLWDRYNSTEIGEGEIPLFASLPKIHSPSKTIVSEIFERNAEIVDKNEQLFLKKHRIVHFVLDGYDELYSQVNLFGQTDLNKFNGKIIISCRNESLPDLKLLSPPNSEIMKIYLTPWTEQQVSEYITKQAIDDPNNFGKFDKFQKLIESIPSLKEFIQTPFHLKIIIEILPQISGKLNGSRIMNRYEIYDLFIQNKINQAIQNRAPLDHLEMMNLTSEQLPDAVIQQCIEWSIEMRNKKSTTLSFNMTKSKIVPKLQSLSKMNGPEQILKWLSPLWIEKDGDIVNCRFIHATIGEFFLVYQLNQILSETKSTPETLLEEIKKHPIFSELLGISTWQFISDVIKSNEELKKEIWNLIELSKKSEEFSILAANCASIWNVCGCSFAGKDLRNIKIPGAVLNHAIFYGTDLSNANLKGCKLKDSILSEANLEGADLSDVKFGEMAPWKLEHTYRNAIIHENQFIGMNSETEEVEIWNLSTRKLAFSWKCELSFLANMQVIQRTILVAVPSNQEKISFLDLKSGESLFEFNERFGSCEFNADGSLMCSRDPSLKKLTVWDLKTFKDLCTTEYDPKEDDGYYYSGALRFSLDNRYVLIFGGKEVIIFDISTGKLVQQFQSFVKVHDFFGLLWSCSFSVDSQNVIGISKTELFCWNLNTKSYRSKKFDHSLHRIWNIPNQDEILLLDASGNLIFLNFKSFTIVKVISLVTDCLYPLFSQDGTLFASTSADGMFHLVDLKERKLLHSIVIQHFQSKMLSFSRKSIYFFQNNQFIRNYLWDSEESINTLERSAQQVDSLHLTNDSKLISQQFLTICAWSCDSGQPQFTCKIDLKRRQLGSCWCGQFFVLCSDNLEVSFWKVGAQSISVHHKLKLKVPNFSEADSISKIIQCSSNGEVVVISISSEKLDDPALFIINIDSYSQSLQSFSDFNPKQKIFVTKEMIVWNVHSNFLTLKGQIAPNTLIGLAPGHEIRLATDFEVLASNKNSIQLIAISTGVVTVELKSFFSNPTIFYLCERKRFLVIGDEFGGLEIWDLSDKTIKKTVQLHEKATAICASKDFSQLFVGTSNGSIWNFKRRDPKIELNWVQNVSLLATNANLQGATISDDNLAILELHGLKKRSETPNLRKIEISEERNPKLMQQMNQETKREMEEQQKEKEMKEEIDNEQSIIQQNFKEIENRKTNLDSLVEFNSDVEFDDFLEEEEIEADQDEDQDEADENPRTKL